MKKLALVIACALLILAACTNNNLSGDDGYAPNEAVESTQPTEIDVLEAVGPAPLAEIEHGEPAIEESEEPAPGPVTAEAAPWQVAYAEILRYYYANVPPPDEWFHWEFFLHDVNRDGTPELFIVYIAAGIWSESTYTFMDGEAKPIAGDFFAYFGIYPPLDRPGIITQAYNRTTLMVLDGDELVVELALRAPFAYLGGEGWYINDIEVTEDEFAAVYNSIMPARDGGWENRVNIWPDPISEDNIRDIVLGWSESP